MSKNKTQPTQSSVDDFLATVEPAQRRTDGMRLVEIMRDVTGAAPQMWGPSIVGFGTRHYTYATGREGDWMRVGFSPRKAQLSLYGLIDHPDATPLLENLGPHTTGVACLYAKKLEALNEGVLRDLIALGFSMGDYTAPGTTA